MLGATATMDSAFLAELRNIPWFSNCGNDQRVSVKIPIKAVTSWDQAMQSLASPSWEDVELDAQARLTEFLNLQYRAEYQEWNEIANVAKSSCIAELASCIWQPYADAHAFGKAFVDSVSWDVLGAVMEHEYRACTNRPTFFLELLSIYQARHLPCGWEGAWPAGNLLVI